jgi:hypothetical protein
MPTLMGCGIAARGVTITLVRPLEPKVERRNSSAELHPARSSALLVKQLQYPQVAQLVHHL